MLLRVVTGLMLSLFGLSAAATATFTIVDSGTSATFTIDTATTNPFAYIASPSIPPAIDLCPQGCATGQNIEIGVVAPIASTSEPSAPLLFAPRTDWENADAGDVLPLSAQYVIPFYTSNGRITSLLFVAEIATCYGEGLTDIRGIAFPQGSNCNILPGGQVTVLYDAGRVMLAYIRFPVPQTGTIDFLTRQATGPDYNPPFWFDSPLIITGVTAGAPYSFSSQLLNGTITVAHPAAFDDSSSTVLNTPVSTAVAANDDDFADPVTVTLFAAPVHGTVQITGSPGPRAGVLATYTPDAGYAGLDSYQYEITDSLHSSPATVRITVNPKAVNDGVVTDINQPVTIPVLENDLSFADPVTVGIVAGAGNGTLVVNNSPGPQALVSVTYTPDANYVGPDSFVYSATSSTGTNNATVFIDVTGPDADGDGTADVVDNCVNTYNATQLDVNGDGYGNACDADLNNSGLVTTADFAILRSVLNQSAGSSATAAAADLNGSATVTTADFAILRARLNSAPGPSGYGCGQPAGSQACP